MVSPFLLDRDITSSSLPSVGNEDSPIRLLSPLKKIIFDFAHRMTRLSGFRKKSVPKFAVDVPFDIFHLFKLMISFEQFLNSMNSQFGRATIGEGSDSISLITMLYGFIWAFVLIFKIRKENKVI